MADAPDSIVKCIADLRESQEVDGPTGCWRCMRDVADRLEVLADTLSTAVATLAEAAQNRCAAPPSPPVAAPAGIDAGALAMLIAAAKSGDPGTIKLATILAGVPPCDNCGYAKAHCRCSHQPPSPSTAPLSEAQIEVIVKKHGATSYRNRADTNHPAYGFTLPGLQGLIDEVRAAQLPYGFQLRSPECWCGTCDTAANKGMRSRMSLCPACGDKRCPRAAHHDRDCQRTAPEASQPPCQATALQLVGHWDMHGIQPVHWVAGILRGTFPDSTPLYAGNFTADQRKDLLAAALYIAARDDETAVLQQPDAERITALLSDLAGMQF